MRNPTLIPALVFLLHACGGDTPQQEAPAPEPEVLKAIPPEELPGYFSGKYPGLDGRIYATTLYVRGDGTYILQEMDTDNDSIPRGSIGEWQPVAGGLELDAMRNGRTMRWIMTGSGLRLDMRGADPEAMLPKMAGELFDDTPRMRVLGNYRWQDDTQTFQPCGADKAWPAGMGLGIAEKEGGPLEAPPDLLTLYRAARVPPGQPLMMEVVGHIGLGPSMEGGEAEEYFFVHRMVEVIEEGHCR